MEDVVKSALGIPTEGYLHQLYFRYPLKGGFEKVVQQLIKPSASLKTNFEVQKIARGKDGWRVNGSGGTRHFEHLVISFPIHEAVKCFNDVPKAIVSAIGDLRYNSVRIVFLAVNNESLMGKSAVYIPDPSVLPHRVCYMGFFSPNMVKPRTSSLIAEVTAPPGGELDRMSDDALVEESVRGLESVGILKRGDIIASETRRFEYGYPVYNLNYSANMKRIRAYFSELGVDLLGRFAEFEYINSDECIHRAITMARRLNKLPHATA